uniref:PDEase domain-containing protein n=1 Tax=Echeneis naucrates TaxID=173247 RepID=A0A665X123_ECHNA
MDPSRATLGGSPPDGTESFRRETASEPGPGKGMGWFFSPLWSPRSRTRSRRFGEGMKSEQVEAWLDDHSDFTRAYFLRRASNISSFTDRLRPLPLDWMDRCSPDVLGDRSPCSPRSCRFSFSPCRPLSPVCPCSPDLPLSPQLLRPTPTKATACGHGEGCPWMMELLRGGLSWMGSVAELCQGAVLHAGELLAADVGSLALVKKECGGRSTLEEVIAPTVLGCSSEGNICSEAHLDLLKGIMGCVLETGSPMNMRDTSEDTRFALDEDQSSEFKIRTVLSVPIKKHRGEVVGVVVMINKRSFGDASLSAFTSMDEKVLSNHMDVLGLVLDNVQLYESSRQEAKRSQVLSKEHHSFEVLLSKMAATIMPSTHAQYCTIFIPSEQASILFSRVIHLECEELGSTCQIYRRERDISDIDPSYAHQTLVAMETLNISESSEGSVKSLICCPVRNERSENVIAVCQLMKKCTRDSDDMEAFNKYDERLLEDLAMYCGLALQYAQAVQMTEERRASIEVTQEVLAYHITAAEQEIQALQEVTIPSADELHILDFHFSDFGLPEDVTTQATVRMFLDLNLVQEFNIDYKVTSLCQWVLTVRRGYRNNVPYHNWNHALCTAQSMFAMLMAAIFSRLEILALMIATLSHDLDHRGTSSASIFPSPSLYFTLLHCVALFSQGSQILSGLSPEDHRAVLHLIKRAILATDLTVFMEYVKRRNEFFSLSKKSRVSWKTEKKRELLSSMLMTASDLSAITKPWPEQQRIANLVAMEFFAQGDKEKEEFKIKPIDIMNRENSTRLPFMQVEYIDEICYPLYKVLFGTCSPLLTGCKKNRENWLRLTEESEEENSDVTTET